MRALQTAFAGQPWSVDRYGRLIAGVGVLTCTALGLLHHPAWHWVTLVVAGNLLLTAITNRCALHDLLVRLGAQEREELYLPGGIPRMPEFASTPQRPLV